MQKIYTKLRIPFPSKNNLFLILLCFFFTNNHEIYAQTECPPNVIRSVDGVKSTFRFNSEVEEHPTFGCLQAQSTFSNTITLNNMTFDIDGATAEGSSPALCYIKYTNENNQPFFPISVDFGVITADDCSYETSTGTAAGPAGFLPVEFTRFSGEPLEDEVYLQWQTASELNNSHFNIARSSNGKDWKMIGSVDGSGTTQQTINYSFTDDAPLRGANYYALIQVDFDGKLSNSDIIAVTVANEKPLFEIYPNPVSDELHIRLSEEEIDFPMEIYLIDAAGRQIAYTTVEDLQTSMDVSNLEKGFYFLQIRTNHQFFNQRFMKR